MTMRPAVVIAGWGLANLVLAGLMFLFDENPVFIVMYLVASVPVLLGALVVGRIEQRTPGPATEYRLGQRSGLMLPLALGVTIAALGLIYGSALVAIGLLVALIATITLSSQPVTPRARPDEPVLPYPVSASSASSADDAPPWLHRLSRVAVVVLTVSGWRKRNAQPEAGRR